MVRLANGRTLARVPVQEMVLIALAAFGAGAINVVAGSGTLITFPTLIAFGYPPVVATMSNAVGLTVGSMTGVWGIAGSCPDNGRGSSGRYPPCCSGALIGSFLLLHLPEKTFVTVVPVLLILALVLVVVGPKIQAWARRRSEAQGRDADHVPPGRMAALTGETSSSASTAGISPPPKALCRSR